MALQNERLEQAFDIFLQYGFKKASMQDLAAAMGISRQGLYKHYATKQELFEYMCDHMAADKEKRAKEAFAREDLSVRDRLVMALDCWCGQSIDRLRSSPHSKEIIAIAEEGVEAFRSVSSFYDLLRQFVAKEKICANAKEVEDMVLTIFLAIKGLIHTSPDHETFLKQINAVLNVVLPVEGSCSRKHQRHRKMGCPE